MDFGLANVFLILIFITCVFSDENREENDYHRKNHHRKRKNHHNREDFKGLDEKKDVKKYFQDIYSAQLVPDEKEFGHVFEDPLRWEQRFEKIHLDNNRHQGKVKWGDDKGGYGEYYFDFNHGGGEDDEENDKNKENKENDRKNQKNIKNYGKIDDDHDENDDNNNNNDKYNDFHENDGKINRKSDDIHDLYHHKHSSDVEVLPGYDFKGIAPYHGGNYRKL